MNTDAVPSAPARHDEVKKPICGIVSIALSLLGILVPLVAGSNFGGDIDSHARYIIPWVGYGLAALAFFRRERAIWPILGVAFNSLYLGLHLVAVP
jgi:hypothetical protein